MDTHTVLIIIDIVGLIIGTVSIYSLRASSKKLGGRVASAINLFIVGVVCMMLAFAWTLVFSRLELFPNPFPIDAHHALMTLGMILFVLAARRFSLLIAG